MLHNYLFSMDFDTCNQLPCVLCVACMLTQLYSITAVVWSQSAAIITAVDVLQPCCYGLYPACTGKSSD